MATRNDKTIQFSEYTKHFTDQVQNADEERDSSMQRLQTIRAKRQKSQARQLNRLAEKYGEHHARVKRQANRIVSEQEMETYLSLSIKKSQLDHEVVDGGFVFKGRVLDGNAKALVGHTVQLQDKRNNVIGKPVKTDSEGFYSVYIDAAEPYDTAISAYVLDKQGTQIHQEHLPVLVTKDAIESRDIVVTNVGTATYSIDEITGTQVTTQRRSVGKKTVAKKTKTVKKTKTTRVKVAKKVSKKAQRKSKSSKRKKKS